MDPGTLFVKLLLLQQLAWAPTHIHYVCAHTSDPTACYDEWQAYKDDEAAVMVGNWNSPTQTAGSFYNYIEPKPLPQADRTACDSQKPITAFCY
jgi:hypothetical protein